MHPVRFIPPKLAEIARRNRREIVESGLTRRELFRMGLLTSSGYLIAKPGLSAQGSCDLGECRLGCSPPTEPFVDPLFIPPVLLARPLSDPAFRILPNRLPSGQAQDARNEPHQF